MADSTNINTLNTLIQLRRGTEAQWEAVKDAFIPAAGEPCVTLDGEFKGQLKIGDGVSSWAILKYAGVVDAEDLTADGKAIVIKDGVITLSGLDSATAGQSFRINATGDGIEWFETISTDDLADELAKKVDNKFESADGATQNIITNDADGVKIISINPTDANKGGRLIVRKDGVYYSNGMTNDTMTDGNKLATMADIEGAMHFRGTVPTQADLPTDPAEGDIYQITDTEKMVIWDGTTWNEFHAMNMDGYVTEDELGTTLQDYATIKDLEDGKIKVKIPEATAEESGLMTPEQFKQLGDLDNRASMVGIQLVQPVVPGVVVNYFDNEMRLMFPADTAWTVNREGKYFVPVRVYAPANAKYFKESLALNITDNTWYEFENNDFAGIDENGVKYSLIWFPVAGQNADNTWTYYGSKSTSTHFIGWFYHGEWYDENKKLIGSNIYRINLSNEALLNVNTPYYVAEGLTMEQVQKAIDDTLANYKVSTDKLYNGDKIFVIDGGTPIVPTPPAGGEGDGTEGA